MDTFLYFSYGYYSSSSDQQVLLFSINSNGDISYFVPDSYLSSLADTLARRINGHTSLLFLSGER